MAAVGVVKTKRPGAPPGFVVAPRGIVRPVTNELVPIGLQLDIEPVRDLGSPPSCPVGGDPYLGRVADHAARIERCELNRDAADEVPRTVSAGEEVRHDSPPCWSFCWTFC